MSSNIKFLPAKVILPKVPIVSYPVDISKQNINDEVGSGFDTRYTVETPFDKERFNYLLQVQSNLNYLTNQNVHFQRKVDTAKLVLNLLEHSSYSMSGPNIRNGGLLDEWVTEIF
jgi:hypothetical protein